LTDLRQELSVLRSRNADLEAATEEAAERPPESPDEDGGFFEEDEDETIALTGAELDNILNTAEFTEEDGEPTELDESELDFLPEEGGEAQAADEQIAETEAAEQTFAGESGAAEAEGESGAEQAFEGEPIELEVDEGPEETSAIEPGESAEDIALGTETEDELEEESDILPLDELPEVTDDLVEESAESAAVTPEEEEIDVEAVEGESPAESETVEDFEATLGYSEQVGEPETAGQPEDVAEDALADRHAEPEEEEIDLGVADDEDIIPLEPDASPSTEEISFEDTGSEDNQPIQEIELEELPEEEPAEPEEELPEVEEAEIPRAEEAAPSDQQGDLEIPSLDDLQEEELTLSDDDNALPDLDIDAELEGIEELADEPEEPIEQPESVAPESVQSEPMPPAGIPGTPRSEPRPQPSSAMSDDLKGEIRSVLSYMDQLLESLPEEKIEEFAKSEHFEVYKRLFEELGLER
jgi:hypothetical protein